MSKKLFLLETDEALNGQLISYLKNFFDINLENFDSAENLFKASVSQQPEIIIFGINDNSKKLFPKLASFKNSFNTKLIALVSQKEKGYIQSLEITHHILYKPFTFNELDYCLKSCAIAKKKGADNTELKKKIFQNLDIVEKDNFDFHYKKTFKDNSVVRMEDVQQELYDDINVLDSNVEGERLQTPNILSSLKNPLKNQGHRFSPEVKLQAKKKDLKEKSSSIHSTYFKKLSALLVDAKKAEIPSSKEDKNSSDKIASIDLSQKKFHQASSDKAPLETKKKITSQSGVLSAQDFNINFLDD